MSNELKASLDAVLRGAVAGNPGVPGVAAAITDRHDAPTGRPAGALAWAGLANLYYWIDRKNGIGGYWATQILPFADPASVEGFLGMETAVYKHLA